MDVQFTDGKGMILQYVTSYVTKWQDAFNNDALFSPHVSGFKAALRHLQSVEICEPEMYLQMSSIKMAWTPTRTKRFAVPSTKNVATNVVYRKYKQRSSALDNISFLQWPRLMHHTPATPKPYKQGSTLVGLQMVSPFSDEFFFQDMLINFPHKDTDILYHPRHAEMPSRIKFFASAVANMPEAWEEMTTVRVRFETEGHKEHYVSTIVSHVQSLFDALRLWNLTVLPDDPNICTANQMNRFAVDDKQAVILQHVKDASAARDAFYNSSQSYYDEESSDEEEYPISGDDIEEPDDSCQGPFLHLDWRKTILVEGKPGTGKTQTMLACIEQTQLKR